MPGINFIKDGRKPQAGPDKDNKIRSFKHNPQFL